MLAHGSSPGRDWPPRRRGFGLIELLAAGVIFAAILGIALQVSSWTAAQRRSASRREAAARAAGNLMERILARPAAEINPEATAALAEAENRGRPAVAGRLRIAVVAGPAEGGVVGRRVVVEVAWAAEARVAEAPVRLVAWAFDREARP